MDKEVKLQKNLDFSCSGTTAVVVIRQGEGLVIANLGDSRAILGRIHDEELVAIQLTTDLKPGLPCKTHYQIQFRTTYITYLLHV
ncbi:putative PPM-type phosphatase domain, protein phosphatase 2C family [Lupinus albus]|uniref:Putative PPM-type phosphatase domain, protein phosphatase 2C family n=1 Tax=Lupinus albus TaxID=3870 RepID=A0A6A4PC21_LUPAL|nr:putative PPM-type phosphatase domain, protein phosphatase 2C family [Lupinus albus]